MSGSGPGRHPAPSARAGVSVLHRTSSWSSSQPAVPSASQMARQPMRPPNTKRLRHSTQSVSSPPLQASAQKAGSPEGRRRHTVPFAQSEGAGL